MSYKSLLTVVTDPDQAKVPLAHAVALATELDAHLEALCLGVDRSQAGYYYAGANAMILQESLERAQAEAGDVTKAVKAILKPETIRWSIEDGVVQLVDIARHVALRARFSDLVVLAQPYGEGRGAEAEAVVEAALFDGDAPVLVVPAGGDPMPRPKTVIVAWNQSREAMTAVRAALPFLRAADLVRVVVIDPPQHGPERSDPGGFLGQMLARQGVHCEIDVLSKTMPRVADVLNRHVQDKEGDLVVMGAYGHSRFREAILGGATRNMLEGAKVPVLMAH